MVMYMRVNFHLEGNFRVMVDMFMREEIWSMKEGSSGECSMGEGNFLS
jgi:hypothetical protein